MTTAIFSPLDEAARLRIRESLDENLFVEAGAGTGKTTSLVDRVVSLVSSGRATLDKIAARTESVLSRQFDGPLDLRQRPLGLPQCPENVGEQFLAKPFRPTALRACVRQILDRSQRARGAASSAPR